MISRSRARVNSSQNKAVPFNSDPDDECINSVFAKERCLSG